MGRKVLSLQAHRIQNAALGGYGYDGWHVDFRLVWCMKSWVRTIGYAEWAAATMRRYGRDRGARTQLVLELLKVLGLVPARGRGLKAPADPRVHAVHSQHKEFVAVGVSKRGWAA